MRGVVVARWLAGACVALLAASLAFRGFIYSRMYIEPGAPMGASDIVEFAIGLMHIFSIAASLIAAAWLAIRGPRPNRVAAAWLALVGVAVFVTAGPLHTVVARWASA
jgi:hypothetical protein